MKRLTFIIILCALLLTSCATKADSKTLLLKLKENPTTGYSWEWETDSLVLVEDKYVQDKHKPGMVGVGGVRILGFEALGPGQAQLKLFYKRSWEQGSVQIIELIVDVDEKLGISIKDIPQTSSLLEIKP